MIDEAAAAPVAVTRSPRLGLLLAGVILCIYGGLAVAVDFPRAALGIQSDEATYYMMGHSLAEDGDLTYRREDLVRVWKEFSSGPSGVFLKKGSDILDWGLMRRPPFFWTRTQDDPDQSRLFYGKSFVYPLAAAPFVKVFGTNGFLVLHALLMAMVVWCAFEFLQAQTRPAVAALLAGGFVMATVVPVYFVWITPELFNFSLGLFAYFCWLYKEVAPPGRRPPRGLAWLLTGRSDLVAAALVGIATFSKPTNALLVVPIALWLLIRRRWGRALAAGIAFLVFTVGLFGANMAVSGDWSYQGGDRKTFYWEFPFQTAGAGFDVGTEKSRDEALGEILFNPSVFWTNLAHSSLWFFTGRNAGLVAYYFPAVFALVAFLATARRRPLWQYLVLLGAIGQMLVFIVGVPYTWNGGGGSVGNRYFMGAYGIFLFLMPPLAHVGLAVVPLAVGGLFTAPLVLNPFVTSFKPGDHAKSGPFRWLPLELTLVYDWPINNQPGRTMIWFGDRPKGSSPGFQIYFVDDNSYVEGDGTFWTRGESRAEFLIKTDRPMKRAVFTVTAGPVPAELRVRFSGRSQEVPLAAGESRQIAFAMGDGFPYQGIWPVWTASIETSSGFVPIFHADSKDARFLGVRVTPTLVE